MGRRLLGAMLALSFGAAAEAQVIDDGPCGIPPPPSAKRIKGGEGVPPLPLPATPLRRTERKRDPTPPILIGKVVWGEKRILKLEDGREIPYADWNLDPNDVHRLLSIARSKLGIHYRAAPVQLSAFSFDPAEIPILFITGVRAVSFSPDAREKLRAYCDRGGFLLADACRGSRVFAGSVREEFRAIFPDRPLRVLPPDHPIFSAHRRLDHVRYTPAVRDRPEGAAFLEGVDAGCRTMAVISPYGLSCAWDSDHVVPGSLCVVGEDAHDLGMNIIGYVLAMFDLARFYAAGGLTEPFVPLSAIERATGKPLPAAATPGEFVFAQLLHEGRADPDPTAFTRLLEAVMANTSINLRLSRVLLKPEDTLASHPFLSITGHEDFTFSKEGAERLRAHLASGGFLLADACCGAIAFDAAFRREIGRVLPDRGLEPLKPDHPIYTAFYALDAAELTPKARATFAGMGVPYLEGIAIDGALRVLYSPLDLGNGWEGIPHPYARGYADRCAVRIGVNAIVYALSH